MTERRLRILTLLTEETLWKKRVAARFDVSVQTIGRDVDALHADGLLRDTLVMPDEGPRSMYIAFATTEQGEAALDEFRVCAECGAVVDARQDCVHEYVPVQDAFDTGGGDR